MVNMHKDNSLWLTCKRYGFEFRTFYIFEMSNGLDPDQDGPDLGLNC